MNLLGIDVPPLAVAVGSIIVAFITGLGFGMGSETGKYFMQKYLKPKYAALHTTVNKLHNKVLKPVFKQTKRKSILYSAFKNRIKPKPKPKRKINDKKVKKPNRKST